MVELQRFINDRGIAVPRRDRNDKLLLAEALIEADKKRTFTKLFDLPPELRKLIYEFYVCDFGNMMDRVTLRTVKNPLESPAQPPLAQVCRTLRQEVLPVFYSTCHFRISLRQRRCAWPERGRLPLEDHSLLFLKHLSSADLGSMRKFELYFNCPEQAEDGVCVDLDSKKKLVWIASRVKKESNHSKVSKEIEPKLLKAVQPIVTRILKREGKKLRLKDIYDMRNKIEKFICR
jgi:hypothetical protein